MGKEEAAERSGGGRRRGVREEAAGKGWSGGGSPHPSPPRWGAREPPRLAALLENGRA